MNRSVRLTWWGVIAIVLVIVLAVSFIGKITGGFSKDWEDVTILDRNPDNLLSGEYGWKDDVYNVGDGYKLTAKNDGSIVITGEYTGTDGSASIVLEKVTLAAGTYTLSGAPNGGNATYLLKVTYGSNNVIGDFGAEGGTFTLSSSTEVTLQLVLYPEHEFLRTTVRPVIVEGSEAGDFYE